MIVHPLPLTKMHVFNIFSQLTFDILLLYHTTTANSLVYLLLSSFLAGSLHPCAGHFIAEHYVFDHASTNSGPQVPIPETYSYYGPLNYLTYNVGLHNEHHDFPAVPWTRLPRLHTLAKEFYQDLPAHPSWVGVVWRFVWDRQVGIRCRVKRRSRRGEVGEVEIKKIGGGGNMEQ